MSEWHSIVEGAAETLPKAHVLTYFQNSPLASREKTLVVGIPREFFVDGWKAMPKLLLLRLLNPFPRLPRSGVRSGWYARTTVRFRSTENFFPMFLERNNQLPEKARTIHHFTNPNGVGNGGS